MCQQFFSESFFAFFANLFMAESFHGRNLFMAFHGECYMESIVENREALFKISIAIPGFFIYIGRILSI